MKLDISNMECGKRIIDFVYNMSYKEFNDRYYDCESFDISAFVKETLSNPSTYQYAVSVSMSNYKDGYLPTYEIFLEFPTEDNKLMFLLYND